MKEATTYLTFDGNCGDAVKFYERCLGAELHMMGFSEAPGNIPESSKNRVMHAKLAKGENTILMASDTMPGMPLQQGNNFSVSIQCESLQEIEGFFTALGEKGKITMQLQDTFWGAHFGMLTDQFGINWMFNFEKPRA
jgi:PhnB protein